jgi:ParB/RepB/Spo0J family partition protein
MVKATALQDISPDKIRKNPDNPRLIFREAEMNELLESIGEVGIKVPISVYEDGARYTLLDGERRWRCAKKLNLRSVPAIVQPKPTRLENLLMMFNIHNVRVDWDPMPMALKLGEIRRMLEKEGKDTGPKALAAITGVRLASVRRALELLDLPTKYQRLLLREGLKPYKDQRIKPDLFIEIYKSLHAIERYTPEVFDHVSSADYVDAMVVKYRDGVIDNVVKFRDVSKIARAERAGIDRESAIPVVIRLVRNKEFSIDQAYKETVEAAYEQRDLLSKVRAITERLKELRTSRNLAKEMIDALRDLSDQVGRLLGR